ncbi:MAG: glycosyltransferase [archaeon]
MKLPKISVVIPVALHENCGKAVQTLKKIDYPASNIEITVVKGNRPCTQRNKAAFQSKGEILYFLDNDSIIQPDAFKRAVKHYSDKNLAGAGGPALTHNTDTFLQKSFGIMLGSYFSSLSMASRFRQFGKKRKTGEKQVILCNLSMRRDFFVEIGGLNELLYPNEECELANRIIEQGHYFIHDPKIVIYRSNREGLINFSRQLWKEGWGRTRHFILHPSFFEPLYTLPGLFVIYLISLAFISNMFYLIPFAIYLMWVLLGSVDNAIKGKSIGYFFTSIPLFFLFHISYGIGTITGLCKYLDPKLKHKTPLIKLKKIKSFGETWEKMKTF